MDLPCLNCGEPWDLATVLRDAPHVFTRRGCRVQRCPACPPTGRPLLSPAQLERLEAIAALAELAGDDLDGFVATLEDFGLG